MHLPRAILALLILPLVSHAEVARDLAALESKHGGRLGVAAVDTADGRSIGHRTDERFALCSTFKLLLAAAVLAQVDAGEESLDRRVPFTEADLLDHSPVTRAHLAQGAMTVGELCAATVQVSDNAAANLLLPIVDGPAGLTRWLRSVGDATTRLDRYELALNTNLPGDPRDTTTPAAMAETTRRLITGEVLSRESREELIRWLVGSTTGGARLRAGLREAWKVGDKTGTGQRGAANDVAVVWPREGAAPWIIAVYYDAPESTPAARDRVIAEAARLVAGTLAR